MTTGQKKSLQQLHPKRIDVILLIFASAYLLSKGLQMPILTVRKFWEVNTFSILSGITGLWQDKYYYLAAIIFFFSMVFPVVKLAALFLIWFVKLQDEQRKWLLHALSILGKWSMLDVFVAAILIVSIRLGALASAKVESGIYYFASSILLAMVVTTIQNYLANRSHKSK